MATLARKIYNEEVTDKLQFLELIKSQICKSYKGITRKQSDLINCQEIEKEKGTGMGGLSNEISNLMLMVFILLLRMQCYTKLVQKFINSTRLRTQNRRQMKPR